MKEGLFFLGEDMPGDDHLEKAFRALAGVDDLIGKDELGAFVDIDDDDRFSIGQMTQNLLDKIATYGGSAASGTGDTDDMQGNDGTDASNGTDASGGASGSGSDPDAYTGGVSPNSAYPNVGSHITRNSMAHDPDRVGLGTLGDDLHMLAGADGALNLSELMQAFNISSVKAQAILDGLSDGGPVKVDDLIEAMEEYATGASPKMLTDTKLDEALRDIMGEVKTHFGSFADENGRIDADRFRNLLEESFRFLGRDLPGQSLIDQFFKDIAGVDERLTEEELGAFIDMDEDGRFSIGKLAQKAWEKSDLRRAERGEHGANRPGSRRRPHPLRHRSCRIRPSPFPESEEAETASEHECDTDTGTTTSASGNSGWAPTSYSNVAWSSFFNPVPTT